MSTRKPTLFILFLIVFLDLMGFGIIIPLLPVYSEKMGASGALLGAAFSCFSLMQFLFAPIWGRLSDRFGRRPILLVSLLGSSVSYLIFANAANIWIVMLSRVLAGTCGANFSVATAYVADITTRENRSKGMGVIGAAFGLGFLFGPLLGTAAAHYGDQAPAYLAAALCGFSFILAIFILPESVTREQARAASEKTALNYFAGWSYVLQKEGLKTLILIGFIFNLALTQWETTFALFLSRNPLFGLNLTRFLWLLAYVGLLVVMIQGGLIGRLIKRWGEVKLLRFGLLMLALSLGLMPYSQNMGQLIGALTLLGLAMGFSRPVVSGAISLLAHPSEQGLVMGVFLGVSSLARIVGPLIGGKLVDLQFRLPLLVASLFGLIAWALAFRVHPKVLTKQSHQPL